MNNNPLIKEILVLAQLAPSIHNTQMWQLKLTDNNITIFINKKDLVPIADPDYRDTWVSLGILTSVIQNLFKEYGGTTEYKLLQSDLKINTNLPILTIKFSADKLEKPSLSNYINLLKNRRSFRGIFVENTSVPILKGKNIHIISKKQDLKKIGNTYHQCAAAQSLNKGYMDELRNWIRLHKNENGFANDGLDYISLNLTSMEILLAKAFLNDKWLQRFKLFGLHGLLTDESKNFKNISGVAIKVMDSHILTPELLIKEGKHYIKIWLDLVEQGFEACPISTLIDLPKGQSLLKSTLSLPNGSLFSVALRFGKGDKSPLRRVRRPLDQWIIS